jgi:hypothetical protein
MSFLTAAQKRKFRSELKKLTDILAPCCCGSTCIALHVQQYADHPDETKATEFKNMLSFVCSHCDKSSAPHDSLIDAVAEWEQLSRTASLQ